MNDFELEVKPVEIGRETIVILVLGIAVAGILIVLASQAARPKTT